MWEPELSPLITCVITHQGSDHISPGAPCYPGAHTGLGEDSVIAGAQMSAGLGAGCVIYIQQAEDTGSRLGLGWILFCRLLLSSH